MIYDLPWYTIILTFIIVIDSRLTLNILKMGLQITTFNSGTFMICAMAILNIL